MKLISRRHTPEYSSDCESRYVMSLGRKSPAVIHTTSALMLVAAVCCVVTLDVPIAGYFSAHPLPGSVVELHNVAELFGHGIGVVLVIAALASLDPLRRWIIPRLAFAAWGGGMAANLLKVCVTRLRPHAFDTTAMATSWTSFAGGVEGIAEGSVIQSFPSAHVATAAGLAVVLGRLYPHSRWLFVLLVVTVASQRIGGHSHFVSDCFVGALVGWAAGQVTFQEWWASRWFDRLEYFLGRPRQNSLLDATAGDAIDVVESKYQRAA